MTDAPTATITAAERQKIHSGVGFAISAYTLWGLYAVFFSWLAHVNALEVIAHRAFWSIPVAGAIMLALGRTADIMRVVRSPKLLAIMCLSTLMVTLSWGFFVWGVAQGRALLAPEHDDLDVTQVPGRGRKVPHRRPPRPPSEPCRGCL